MPNLHYYCFAVQLDSLWCVETLDFSSYRCFNISSRPIAVFVYDIWYAQSLHHTYTGVARVLFYIEHSQHVCTRLRMQLNKPLRMCCGACSNWCRLQNCAFNWHNPIVRLIFTGLTTGMSLYLGKNTKYSLPVRTQPNKRACFASGVSTEFQEFKT